MQHGNGIRQCLHQEARTAGVIQVDVCQEQVVDIGDIDVFLGQGCQQDRDARVDATVDESGSSVFDHEMARVKTRP